MKSYPFTLISYLISFLLGLCLMLYFGHEYVSVSKYLIVLGRMHPLVLHFPIVLIVLIPFTEFLQKPNKNLYRQLRSVVLSLASISALIACIMGLILASEEGYDLSNLRHHLLSGMAVAILVSVMYFLSLSYKAEYNSGKLYYAIMIIVLPLLIYGSHQGALVTHGDHFLSEPFLKTEDRDLTGEIVQDLIMPIFEEKCMSCHNNSKTKGGLNMKTYEYMSLGGDAGSLFDMDQLENSILLTHIRAPLDDDIHMPPKNKKQLTDDELQLLEQWVLQGAKDQINAEDLAEANFFKQQWDKKSAMATEDYDFKPVKASLIKSIRSPLISVKALYSGSTALKVSIFVRETYTDDLLQSLEPIKNNIVILSLRDLPISDSDLEFIGSFENLEELNLNHTDIDGEGLKYLNDNKQLNKLLLNGTKIKPEKLLMLKNHESLKELYTPNLGNQQATTIAELSPIKVQAESSSLDMDPIRLSKPLTENKAIVADGESIVLEHPLNDVQIYYTLDDEQPDSSSTLYTEPLEIDQYLKINVKAYKEGWLSSRSETYEFFKEGKSLKNATLKTVAAKQYQANGLETIRDLHKGDITSFGGNKWLGYIDGPFSLAFEQDVEDPIEKLIVTYGVNMRSHIMAPTKAVLYAGHSPSRLSAIKTISLKYPSKAVPNYHASIAMPIPSGYSYLRIDVHPLSKLPSWHANPGSKGWVFIDELFAY